MTRPWFRTPVLWHSSRVPSGYNYTAMTASEAKMIRDKWRDWYRADWDYAQTTIIFLCTGILVVALWDLFLRIRHNLAAKSPNGMGRNITLVDRLVAISRFATSRQYRVKTRLGIYYSPPLGAIVGVAGITAWVFALEFGTQPLYWPNPAMGHSQPVATRAGWISIALMPIMIALANKVNFIAMLTNTSHEKLQVFHRWTSVLMYITGLIHTFPFIVMTIQEGAMETTWATSPYYWTGVAALVPQTWLVATSWGPLRNRYYETFKKLHFTAALIFMLALFFHCSFRLTSWDYFWATLAIYSVSYFSRVGKTVYNSGLGLPAIIQQLPDNLVSVRVQVPARVKWTPGQHIFIRFLNIGVHALSSHPFTVTSLPRRSSALAEDNISPSAATLDLVLKKHAGITKRLADLTEGKPSATARVFIDGPYGGIKVPLKTYDTVFLLAGGTGATLTVPMLVDLAESVGNGDGRCKGIEFVLAVKGNESPAWLKQDLAYARSVAKHQLKTHIHVTQTEANPNIIDTDSAAKGKAKGEDESEVSSIAEVDVLNGRPDLPRIVHEACQSAVGSIAFVACGPESFLYDVRNAVADCQLAIADGYGACPEIFLHVETYGW